MNLWEQILIRVETKVNRHSFYTWFKPTTFIGADSRTIDVRVPNTLFKDWLTKHYSGVISEAMGELKRAHLTVNFVADAQGDGVAIQLGPREAATLDASPILAVEAAPGPAGLNARYTFDTFI